MADRTKVLTDALSLPAEDRAAIAGVLLRSLEDGEDEPGSVEEAWAEEIRRRVEEVDSGKAETMSADDARRFITSDATKDR